MLFFIKNTKTIKTHPQGLFSIQTKFLTLYLLKKQHPQKERKKPGHQASRPL